MPVETLANLSPWLLAAAEATIGLVWWLLRNKDAAQAKEIADLKDVCKLLFTKHDEDVERLNALKLEIAGGHYRKEELDKRFDRLELSFREGFAQIGAKLDHLAGRLHRGPHETD